jgi:hypothetical protein
MELGNVPISKRTLHKDIKSETAGRARADGRSVHGSSKGTWTHEAELDTRGLPGQQ